MPEIECKGKEPSIKAEQIQDTIEKSRENEINQTLEQKKIPCLPFPQRMNNTTLDKQFQKVLKVFK